MFFYIMFRKGKKNLYWHVSPTWCSVTGAASKVENKLPCVFLSPVSHCF